MKRTVPSGLNCDLLTLEPSGAEEHALQKDLAEKKVSPGAHARAFEGLLCCEELVTLKIE